MYAGSFVSVELLLCKVSSKAVHDVIEGQSLKDEGSLVNLKGKRQPSCWQRSRPFPLALAQVSLGLRRKAHS